MSGAVGERRAISSASALVTTWVVLLTLVSFACAGLAKAQDSSVHYTFILGSGFLCDPGDSSACPATAKAALGDSYEVSGAGAFDAQTKSVKAAGTFTHRAANGNVLETGVWIASELVNFNSYGIEPGALRQQGVARGPQPFSSKRLPMSSGLMPTGGLAVFRILLLPMWGATKTAVLQVNCALGHVPRERSVEGIRLTFERDGNEFSEEVGGRVMFLSMRPELGTPAKQPDQRAAPEPADPQSTQEQNPR